MDNQQAKFILQSWRASGADAGDPHFAEALRQVEHDPELAAWFAREQALDLALGARLKTSPVPEGLREALRGTPAPGTHHAPSRARAVLAWAALFLVLGTVAALWFRPVPPADGLVAFRHEMLAKVSGGVRLAFTSPSVAQAQQWLMEKQGISGYTIPATLRDLPGIGCRAWTWNGKPVGLICFSIQGRGAVHLFIVDQAAVPDAPTTTAPAFAQEAGWTTAAWSDAGKLYLLVGEGNQSAVEKYL